MRGLLLGLAATALSLSGVAHADPDALWKIVSQQCVPNEREYGQPSPCALVDMSHGEDKGFVVLKDLVGDTQYLLMPTAKVTGIEDPAVLAADAPNYFADAWDQRHFTIEAAPRALPRDDVSLVVNSLYGRTQNQLHIHIDCVAPAVRILVRQHIAAIGETWAPFPQKLSGHPYRAMRFGEAGLRRIDPFRRLAASLPGGAPGARAAMGRHTLVVVGATLPNGAPGFVLLDDAANPAAADRGAGEELQDHSCALARE